MITQKKLLEHKRKLNRKLNYYSGRLELGKITETDYLEKIRPVTYALKWHLILEKIRGLKLEIDALRIDAVQFIQLGTPEDFLIRKTNGKISRELDFDSLFNPLKQDYKICLSRLKQKLTDMDTTDLLDELTDIDNDDENSEEEIV